MMSSMLSIKGWGTNGRRAVRQSCGQPRSYCGQSPCRTKLKRRPSRRLHCVRRRALLRNGSGSRKERARSSRIRRGRCGRRGPGCGRPIALVTLAIVLVAILFAVAILGHMLGHGRAGKREAGEHGGKGGKDQLTSDGGILTGFPRIGGKFSAPRAEHRGGLRRLKVFSSGNCCAQEKGQHHVLALRLRPASAKAERMRVQLRAPFSKLWRLYFSLGEWMRSSSTPKPIKRLSM